MSVLFFLQLKRALKAVPRVIAGATIPLLLVGMAVFFAWSHHTASSKTLLSPVALVNQDAGDSLNMILPMITESEAASGFTFMEMSEAAAMKALEKGDVCAALILPKDMVSGILDSTNTPARLYLPKSTTAASLLIGKYAEAGSRTLGASQAGIYSATDLYKTYGLTDHLSDVYYDINTANLKYALSREAAFSVASTTATGMLSLPEYYGCTLFLCILLFFGAGMGSFLGTPAPKTFSDQLRRNGMGTFSLELSLFLPLGLFFFILTFCLGGLAHIFLPGLSFTGATALFLLCLALCFTAFTQLIFSFTKNTGHGLLLFLFLGLFMILFGGGFLPYAFLPDLCTDLTPFLPLAACLAGLRRAVTGALSLTDSLLLLLHFGVLSGLLVLLSLIGRREVHE